MNMYRYMTLALLLSATGAMCVAQEDASQHNAQESEKPKKVQQEVAQGERYRLVAFIKPNGVLQASEKFDAQRRQMQKDMNEEAQDVQQKAQRIAEEKQKLEQEKQDMQNGTKHKFMSPDARQQEMNRISEREAELEKQKNNLEYDSQRLREKYNQKEQRLQMEMWEEMTKAAELVGQEQGWGAVDVASMYVAPQLDLTDDVAQKMNELYHSEQHKKTAAQASANHDQQHNETAVSN